MGQTIMYPLLVQVLVQPQASSIPSNQFLFGVLFCFLFVCLFVFVILLLFPLPLLVTHFVEGWASAMGAY